MLEYLRNAADKPVAKVLISILAFSFVGWGVAEWVFGGGMSDTTLVRVGGEKITMQQFNIEKSRQLSGMDKEQQRAVYTDATAAAYLTDTVLATLTTQQMAQNRANDLGFVVTDSYIAREIREYPEFQSNGAFSAQLFDYVLMNSGYSEADFAAVLRGQVLRSMVLGALSAPVTVPEFAVTAAYNARHAMRDIAYVAVPLADFRVANPTDDQLREYYAQNPRIIPEHRTVSYVLIAGDLAKPDEYDTALATAHKVEDDIIAGETLEAAAKAHGAKFVSLKPFAANNAPKDAVLTDKLVANAFDMDAGLESELIETKQGFVIMRVDAVTSSRAAEFETVKKDLIADWRNAQQRKDAYVRANELLVDLNENGKLAGKKAATVSRANGAPTDVLVAAFNSPVGKNQIVESVDGFYVLQIVDETMPKPDEKKMATLRDELENNATKALQEDYNSFLIREYPIEVDEKNYNRFIKN